jgi:hypothetical protein
VSASEVLGAAELTADQARFWGAVPFYLLVAAGLAVFAWLLYRGARPVQPSPGAPVSSPQHVAVIAVALTQAASDAYREELSIAPPHADSLEGLQICVEALLHHADGWTHFGYGDTPLMTRADALDRFERTDDDFSRRLGPVPAGASEHLRVHVVAFITLTHGELRGLTRLGDRAQSVQCLQARLALPERALIKFHAYPTVCSLTEEQFSTRFPEMERLA